MYMWVYMCTCIYADTHIHIYNNRYLCVCMCVYMLLPHLVGVRAVEKGWDVWMTSMLSNARSCTRPALGLTARNLSFSAAFSFLVVTGQNRILVVLLSLGGSFSARRVCFVPQVSPSPNFSQAALRRHDSAVVCEIRKHLSFARLAAVAMGHQKIWILPSELGPALAGRCPFLSHLSARRKVGLEEDDVALEVSEFRGSSLCKLKHLATAAARKSSRACSHVRSDCRLL